MVKTETVFISEKIQKWVSISNLKYFSKYLLTCLLGMTPVNFQEAVTNSIQKNDNYLEMYKC